MRRTPSSNNATAALAAVLWASSAWALPAPEELLRSALADPAIPYQGRVMVTQWYGKQTHAEEMRVHFAPPSSVRREFLKPDGAVERVSVSDGDTERVARGGKIVFGDAVRSYEKVMPPDRERAILLANYELLSSTADKIAGRPVWLLILRPKIEGKAWQSMTFDQETRVVLRVKRYLPQRPFASQASFTTFEPGKAQDQALFRLDDSTAAVVAAHGMEPDFLTLDQLAQKTGRASRLPAELPGGFVFESADSFKVGKGNVAHARYTDGLTVLSIFETERPVRLPKSGSLGVSSAFHGALRASRAGKVLNWRGGDRHYTLMADLSRELLAEIARALK